MRILMILVVVLAAAVIGAAIYFRSVALPPAVWHVDPATVTPPDSPNFELLVGDRAPVFDVTPDVLAARIDAVATAEGGDLVGGALASGSMSYVVRSRIMGFPDVVSIRLVPVEAGTRLEIFSRSRFGYSDMGVNAARVARWVGAVRAQTGP
jgi:hypothetical protein